MSGLTHGRSESSARSSADRVLVERWFAKGASCLSPRREARQALGGRRRIVGRAAPPPHLAYAPSAHLPFDCLWTLFGPYTPGCRRPHWNGPCRKISDLDLSGKLQDAPNQLESL